MNRYQKYKLIKKILATQTVSSNEVRYTIWYDFIKNRLNIESPIEQIWISLKNRNGKFIGFRQASITSLAQDITTPDPEESYWMVIKQNHEGTWNLYKSHDQSNPLKNY